MAHSNITNFTNFLEKFQGVTDAETEIKNHAKAKAKIAREFIPKMGKEQQKALEAYFCTLRSLREIDNQFRVLLNWQMETRGSVSTFIAEHT